MLSWLNNIVDNVVQLVHAGHLNLVYVGQLNLVYVGQLNLVYVGQLNLVYAGQLNLVYVGQLNLVLAWLTGRNHAAPFYMCIGFVTTYIKYMTWKTTE